MKPLVPLFRGASQLEVTAALKHLRPAKVDLDVTIMEEGDDDPSLAVVLEGRIELSCGSVDVGSVGPNGLVGELELFTGAPRLATARTLEPTKLLTLSRDGYERLRAAGNTVAATLELDALGQLAQRMRRIAGGLARLETERAVPPPTAPTPRGLSRLKRLWKDEPAPRPAAVDPTEVLSGAAFRGLAAPLVRGIADELGVRAIADGQLLLPLGRPSEALVVLLAGRVHATTGPEQAVPLHAPQPGALLGLVSLLTGANLQARYAAQGVATVGVLERGSWTALLERGDVLGSAFRCALVDELATRVQVGTRRLLELERARREQVHGEMAEFLGVEADELGGSHFTRYGIGGHRSGS